VAAEGVAGHDVLLASEVFSEVPAFVVATAANLRVAGSIEVGRY
jgi:hypothetical protein